MICRSDHPPSVDLQQVSGPHFDAALDVIEGAGDTAREDGEVAPEDGQEVRRLLALHHAHLIEATAWYVDLLI